MKLSRWFACIGAALLAVPATAALRTRSLDRVRDEVAARAAAMEAPFDKPERRLRDAYKAVLRQFDRPSGSVRTDATRIRSIAARLGAVLPADDPLRPLLAAGMDEFLTEVHDELETSEERLTLTGGAPKSLTRTVERAHVQIDTGWAEGVPAPKGRWLLRAGESLASVGNASAKVFRRAAPVPVHEFTMDPATGDYLANGKRFPHDDVQRNLTALCGECHPAAAAELKSSVHFTTASQSARVLFPGGGAHGMLDRACGLPATTGLTNSISDINLGECQKCHVGRYSPVMEGFFTASFQGMGMPPAQAAGEAAKLVDGGLDCLICHAEAYLTHPARGKLAAIAPSSTSRDSSPNRVGSARDSRDNSDFDRDGVPDLVIDTNGDGTADAPLMMDTDGDGTPETPWPTVAQDRSLAALLSVGETTEEACLRCHEHARTGYKRGTLFVEGHDLHAGLTTGVFAGKGNQCTVCHPAHGHKFVRGHNVGGDLAGADYAAPAPGTAQDPSDPNDVSCAKCHTPSALSNEIHTARHLEVIACEACHIPYGSGITYSAFGHGGHLAFGRNAEGKDTKLIVADMYVTGNAADLDADDLAYRTRPIYTWFDGGTTFLAQTMSMRGAPNAKITPFKPMANGMAFDARFFSGVKAQNAAGADYNAHSMYRFYANGSNAEAFRGLGMLDMAPDTLRSLTLSGAFADPDPEVQAMGLMMIFPNMVYFDKAAYGYEHYLVKSGSPWDADRDGIIDSGAPFSFDMFAASNAGLRQFQGFNGPMGFPAAYEWYPPFTSNADVITMKLPDGSEIKMWMRMKSAQLPPEQQAGFLAAIENYPSFSQVTLGGHGVAPKTQALGASSCLDCHGASGALAHPVPVGRRTAVDMGPMGQIELPLYRWRYYRVRALTDLGLSTTSEEIVAGTKVVDIDGNATYVRDSATEFVVNWFVPEMPGGYRGSDDATALAGTNLEATDLTTHGGEWMPVLEPVVDLLPNWAVLGYQQADLIWGAK